MSTTPFSRAAAPGCAAPASRPEIDQPGTNLVTDVLVIDENDIIADYVCALFRRSGWTIARRSACADGVSMVNERPVAVAICGQSLRDGTWQDLALAFSGLPEAPALIVISDDPGLVKDVVALGGFDVLVRPLLSPGDVVWSVASAWNAWWKRYEAKDRKVRCFDA